MSVREHRESGAGGDAPPAQPEAQLPRSSFLWLALLILSFIASSLMEHPGKATVTAGSFNRISQAETVARSAFGMSAGNRETAAERNKLLAEAVAAYGKVIKEGPAVGPARKILILNHALGKPLDEGVLTRDLPVGLRARKTPPTEIDAEQRLWRALYGPNSTRLNPREETDAADRVRAMNLGFLEGVALADVYHAVGDPAEGRQREAFREAALRYLLWGWLVLIASLMVFASGLLLTLWFVSRAVAGKWQEIGFAPEQTPENTRPTAPGFGVLMDIFLAYLTLYRLFSVAAGFALPALLPPDPAPQTVVLVTVAVYVFSNGVSLVYASIVLRRQGYTWEALGWVSAKPLADIGYGVLAWFASVPLTVGLGALSQLIFRDSADLAPNPLLPLTAVNTDLFSRALLFLMAAVAAPVLEELFFRGALLTGFGARFGWMRAIPLSALLFAAVHPRHDWIPIFGLGVALGTARVVRGSLLSSITVHVLQNAVAFVMLSTLFSP